MKQKLGLVLEVVRAAFSWPLCLLILVISVLAVGIGLSVASLPGFGLVREAVVPDQPGIFVWDYGNTDWHATHPSWGPVGGWAYFGWNQVESSFAVIDQYLATAAMQGKPVDLTVPMLYPEIGQDTTPFSVYRSIGRIAGNIAIGKGDLCMPDSTVTYPPWSDPQYRAAYADLVRRLGQRYDGDSRIHAFRIASGRYGENIGSGTLNDCYYDFSDGGTLYQWIRWAIDVWAAAFPHTQIYVIASATTDRLEISEYAAARGVAPWYENLAPDLPNSVFRPPRSPSGVIQVPITITAQFPDVPIGYGHFWAANPEQTYWSMLVALSHGNVGPKAGIGMTAELADVLASIRLLNGERLWDWVLRYQQRDAGVWWVARRTEYTCMPTSVECGWEGPWARGLIRNSGAIVLTGRNSAVWKAAPSNLTSSIYGAYGLGIIANPVVWKTTRTWPYARAWAVVSGDLTLTWGTQSIHSQNTGRWEWIEIDSPWQVGGVKIGGTGYLHIVGIEPIAISLTPTPLPTATRTPKPTATATWTPTASPTVTATPKPTVDINAELSRLTGETNALRLRVQGLEDIITRLREALHE